MTPPLPPQSSKPAIGESKNSQQGGFLNFCAPQKKGEQTPSFESLIGQDHHDCKRQDEIEEAEKAKKRRKSPDAALVAAQTQNSAILCAEASLEPKQVSLQEHIQEQEGLTEQRLPLIQLLNSEKPVDFPANAKQPAGSASLSETASIQTEEISEGIDFQGEKPAALPTEDSASSKDSSSNSVLDQDKATSQKAILPFQDSAPASSGTKSATKDDEMVSLVTFEDIQASAKRGVEPAITSTNRLSAFPTISERNTINTIENTDSGSKTSPENFLSGNSSLLPTNGNFAFQKTATSQAASLLKSLSPELEKFQQTGQSQVQLELPVSNSETVKIRLSLRAGEIRSTFITESQELREALQKAWPDFTATHRTQGIRFGDSQFQDSFAHNQDAASEQGRQRQYQQEISDSVLPSKQQQAKITTRTSSQSLPNNKSSSSSINLWA